MLQILVQSWRHIGVSASGVHGRHWHRSLAFSALLLAALAIRAAVAVTQRNIIWPDEVYQTVEPAHHLVFGPWLRSWEWVVGMRSWLPPALLAPALAAGRLIDPVGHLDTQAITAFMLLLSLTPVAVAFLWGERLAGLRGGLFVGGIAAVWVDLVQMAPHPLIDVLAGHTLIVALYLAFPLSERPSARRLAAATAVLVLTVYLRQQLAPAAVAVLLMAGGTSRSAWRGMVPAAGLALAALAALDWITLGTPLQSLWLNAWFNIVKGVSNEYGAYPPLYFVTLVDNHWGLFVPAAAALLLVNADRYRPLGITAGVIFLTMSLIAHKEWRFIFPCLTILTILMALKLLGASLAAAQHLSRRGVSAGAALATAFLAMSATSFAIAAGGGYAQDWTRNRAMLLAFDRLRQSPQVCGVGIHYLPGNAEADSWVFGPGSGALPPGIPQYAALAADNWRSAEAFNAVVIADGVTPPAPFRPVVCFGRGTGNPMIPGAQTCLWTRPGRCDRAAAPPPRTDWPAYFLDERGRVRVDRLSPLRSGAGTAPR